MEEHVNALVSSAEPTAAEQIGRTLQEAGHACTVLTDLQKAVQEAGSGRYELVVSGLDESEGDGIEVLREARRSNPDCQVIVVAPRNRPDQAVSVMQHGALYYLRSPINPAELAMFVDRAVERIALARDREAMQDQLERRYGFENIVGNSRPMQKVFKQITQIAPTNATVLIQGETGTGKELVARAIHYNSDRRHNRFVPLNCAGLAQSLLESELFGHEKGAFTGAVSSRVGLFEYANHGTLFLDEIGDMPTSSQTKLLRVLEHGEVVRVGSNEPIYVDVRLIAATHQDLKKKMQDDGFRSDLFYRLNVVTVKLPPLRERQSDIPLLVERFLDEFSDVHDKPVQGITSAVRKALFRYPWPGNVRELRNCVEHMVVATTDEVLGEDDLPEYMLEEAGGLLEEGRPVVMAGESLEEVEKHHIARTLELVDGNRERAADLLGIGERTLYRKIEKYDLR